MSKHSQRILITLVAGAVALSSACVDSAEPTPDELSEAALVEPGAPGDVAPLPAIDGDDVSLDRVDDGAPGSTARTTNGAENVGRGLTLRVTDLDAWWRQINYQWRNTTGRARCFDVYAYVNGAFQRLDWAVASNGETITRTTPGYLRWYTVYMGSSDCAGHVDFTYVVGRNDERNGSL